MPITTLPDCENEFGLSRAEWDERAPHSPYPPDLAPSDFYFFGHVNQHFAGQEFADRNALLDSVQDILRRIEIGTSDRVFLVWMERSE
jgi:hypothetical protein